MEHTIVMLPIQEEKIRRIFANAKSFAVVSRDEISEENFLAKEALVAAIRNAELSVHSYPERQKNFAEKWASVIPSASGAPAVFSTSILLPKNKIEIQEVSYTEDSRYVSININANEEISKENAVFKTLPTKIDAIFYFDERGARANGNLHSVRAMSKQSEDLYFGELPEGLSQKITIPEQDNVAAVSAPSNGETSAQKIFNIIQLIESIEDASATNPPVPDLLLASLFVETDQFQKKLNEETLSMASSLIKLGADKEKIIGILEDKSPSFARLLGRALARSYPNESLKSMWTFIAEQDLEKTGAEPSLALFGKIMKKIKNILEPRPVFILIWQSKQEVWGIISVSPQTNKEAAEKISSLLSAKYENGNLISGPYKNFSEAELEIQNVLKEVI